MARLADGPTKDGLYNLHKSIGVLIFLLMAARLINRMSSGWPPHEPSLPDWQRTLSRAVHISFYALLLVMPIGGYLANSAYGAGTPFFGLFTIPPILAKSEPLANQLFTLHRAGGYIVAALATLHIAAAFYHFFWRGDQVVARIAADSETRSAPKLASAPVRTS